MALSTKRIFVCAGGTGGHLFPAAALSHEMISRGWEVELITDERASKFSENFPASTVHTVQSATIGGRNPIAIIKAMAKLFRGTRQARLLLQSSKPDVVVGFGGYPTIPPLWAASGLGIPTVLHEQNAVMGRANKLLAKRAQLIGMGFGGEGMPANAKLVGNPVRPQVIEAANGAFIPPANKGRFELLIFGGSQGAHYFSKVIVEALSLLSETQRKRINLVQQVRREDESELKAALEVLGVAHEIAGFFNPMAERIAKAHLLLCRAGASTVSELAVIGRASILVPYPFALDHDQAMNAAAMAENGGCKVIAQSDLSADRLAAELTQLMDAPDTLDLMARNAKATGKPNAAAVFADEIESLVSTKVG